MPLDIAEIQKLFENVFDLQKILRKPLSTQEQFEEILLHIKEFVDYDILSLFSFDHENKKSELVTQVGEPQSLVDAVNFTLGKGGTLHAAIKQMPILIRNQHTTNHFTVNSFFAFPLIFKGQTIGIITLGNYNKKHFSRKQVLYIKIFSIYLQNLLIFLKYGADNKQGK